MDVLSDYSYLFNESDINSDTRVEGRVNKNRVSHNQKLISRYEEIKKMLPGIEKNTSYHVISSDNFGSIELLKVLIDRHKPTELHITTWSYNEDFVELCKSMLRDGAKIYFFVDKSIKTRKPHLYAQMVDLSIFHKNLIIKIHHMLHSKVTTLTNGSEYISIEGSANYSKNQRIENFTITESKDLFNFHKEWMNKIVGGKNG